MDKENYLTVTALTQYIKRKFDVDPYLGRVYLVGEISNLRIRPHAHQYFSLKDDHAKINAIMFRSAFEKVKFTPETGMKVLVTGRLSVYEANGSYQIYIDSMQPDGVGALYQAYEQLKKKLSTEGLFTAPKQTLVRFPKRIAVITSPSGAVIRDIITTTRRRFPIAQLVLFPAQVQGNEAAKEITNRIQQVNELGSFDTIILGRGGGSIEDLWPFNEEQVARAIFASKIPIISSVGHETDTTIADLVADVRAATPTAAAELATPVLSEEIVYLSQRRTRIFNAFMNLLKKQRQSLNRLNQSYVFQDPRRLYEGYVQNIDYLNDKLVQSMTTNLNRYRNQLSETQQALILKSPANRIQQEKQTIDNLQRRMIRGIQMIFVTKSNELQHTVAALDYLSPLKIMGRGYSYVTEQGRVVKKVAELQTDAKIKLHLSDGTAQAKITEIEHGGLEND
ncbi:exodeoxyribonuclease VII large subunit [Pediococcus ethanolidurans]|uniref:Exodeoxyribonuclease 7 large subunit n=2 Tax=Pediococcus ethanolidurans TaxID=319653 RepID=A0A1H9LSW8_9LACO|nr:exodeoxyribonuclease VII large subunit [Pediococcus ethanolidurans]GEN94267.1 exodeoxyribonuclease 7 large subunit [Pediococcus ethanolidurans]SER14369.1 Exodeoxyribonuclease VII large subunit [Pediococcus ethanolidurans]